MATSFSALVEEVLGTLEGYGLNQARSAFLASSIDTDDLAFDVDDDTDLSEGLAEIGDETIYIRSVADNTVTLSPDGRAYRGSVAASHSAGSRLQMNPVFPRALVKRKINEAIIGTWPDLWGEGEYEFTPNPITAAYELPSEVEDVVEVRYEEIAATKEWPIIRNWALDRHADPDTFPNGVSLTIRDGRLTSTTIRVIYRCAPAELDALADDFTDSGLSDTARSVVVYGAAERLVRGMDPSRLAVSTAAADQYASTSPVGTAVQAASFLRANYVQELADEKRRQDLRTPPIIVYTESYL